MAILSTLAATAILPLAVFASPLLPPTPIVGGVAAQAGEFPYIVSLQDTTGFHFCGGTLINAYTVLTAGHCSDQNPRSVRVRAGTLDYSTGGKKVSVSQIVVSPTFDDNTLDGDFALWHLSTPIQQSSTISYSTLAESGSDPSPGSLTTVIGWGTTSEGAQSTPKKLRKVDVPVVARDECNTDYSSQDIGITENMWCAAVAGGGKDSCQGDSGGPIVDSNTGVQIGVVSWGVGCARPGLPGVYTRLGNYVDFINANKWTS